MAATGTNPCHTPYRMYMILYWLSQIVGNWLIPSVIAGSLSSFVVMMLVSMVRKTLSLFHTWNGKRRERKDEKEWRRLLQTRQLTIAGTHWAERREPKVTGSPYPSGSSSPSQTKSVAITHQSKPHNGRFGPWAHVRQGPNIQLIEVRESLHLARFAAAEKLGMDEQTLGRWERGEFLPSRTMLPRLCEGYGKSAEELGFGELEKFYTRTPCRHRKAKVSAGKRRERGVKKSVRQPASDKHTK
jgi:transcriptional regulator with XRE-family HTH domain